MHCALFESRGYHSHASPNLLNKKWTLKKRDIPQNDKVKMKRSKRGEMKRKAVTIRKLS